MEAAEKEKTKRLIEGSLSSDVTPAHTPLVSSAVSPDTPLTGNTSNSDKASTSISGETSTSGDPDMHIVINGNNDIDGDDGKPSVYKAKTQ